MTADTLYTEALFIVRDAGTASTKLLQDRMLIGYNRACDLIKRMRKEGVINGNNIYQCW